MARKERLTAIGFDADDTLWHNERIFRLTEDRFTAMLSEHADASVVSARLLEAERSNIAYYGFGVKGFTLSMIETALEVTGGNVSSGVIREILKSGRDMLDHPVETLPHAKEVLDAVAGRYRVILITKGDLFDQERKLAQSGLGDYFDAVEIVADKSPERYTDIFHRHGDGARQSLMVGNSLKSDIVPVIQAGGWGVHIPHDLTWDLEHAEPPESHPRFRRIDDLGKLPGILGQIS